MDYLQSNPVTYCQEYQGCSLGGGVGIGERPALTYEYSQKGGLLTVAATSSAGGITHTLTVRLEENGGWKYLSDQVKQKEGLGFVIGS